MVTKEQVQNIARLAKLNLSEDQLEKFRSQLEEVIDYNVEKLAQVDTEKVEPLLNVSGLTNPWREDEPAPGLSQDDVLSNTKSKHEGFFKVKAVLE